MKNFEKESTITLFRSLGYIGGPVCIISGLLTIADTPVLSSAVIVVGLIGFNPARVQIFKYAGFRLHSKATLIFSIALVFLGSLISAYTGETEQSPKPEKKIDSKSDEPDADQSETPPSTVCEKDLGNMKMDRNGDPIGSKQPVKVVGNLLKSDTCDIVRVSYQLTGSYGDPIAMATVYDRNSGTLTEIYTKTNVKNEYSGISKDTLLKYTKSGEKSWGQLSSYTGVKYDFNNREMTESKGEGEKPEQSEWDGGVDVVKEYVKSNAKDPSSVKFVEWSKVTAANGFWVVKCKYSGTNSFGATVTDTQWFYIKNGRVEKTKQGA